MNITRWKLLEKIWKLAWEKDYYLNQNQTLDFLREKNVDENFINSISQNWINIWLYQQTNENLNLIAKALKLDSQLKDWQVWENLYIMSSRDEFKKIKILEINQIGWEKNFHIQFQDWEISDYPEWVFYDEDMKKHYEKSTKIF